LQSAKAGRSSSHGNSQLSQRFFVSIESLDES